MFVARLLTVRRAPGRSSVFQRDYLMRLIEQLGTMLRAMSGHVEVLENDEALETSREGLSLLFRLPTGMVESMTPDGLVAMLSAGGGLDAERALLTADVFALRAKAQAQAGNSTAAISDAARARRLVDVLLETPDELVNERAGSIGESLSIAGM